MILRNLSATDFYDLEDIKGLKRLETVPGIKKFVAETISNLREKYTSIEMCGDGINVTKEGYPHLFNLFEDVSTTLDAKTPLDFSMTWGYDISIGTEGAKSPRITVFSGAIDLLEDDELKFLFGHEMGHIVDWLVANQFKVFVSVDGIDCFHDNCRKDINGQPTYTTIDANLSYIKENYTEYWKNNVQIMMTVNDISDMPAIAESWVSSKLFEGKAPYRILEVSTVYNYTAPKLDEASELHIYLPLVEWYKDHPKNSVMSTFFNIWLAEWINRPIYEMDHEIEYPTCIPNNRKLYIDATGNIGICERISDKIRFGSIEEGIDFSRLNEISCKTASFIDQSCSNCEIARVRDICPDILKISDVIKNTCCYNQKVIHRIKLRISCEFAENELI